MMEPSEKKSMMEDDESTDVSAELGGKMSSADREILKKALRGRTKPDYSFLSRLPPGVLIDNPDSDEDLPVIDGIFHEMSKEQSKIYNSQVMESDGFDVDSFPGALGYNIIKPIDGDFDEVEPYALRAIEIHNKEQSKNLKLTRIIKWNAQMACPMNYYITFEAKDIDNDEEDTYQALVLSGFKLEDAELHIFRRKAKRKRPPNDDDDDDDASTASCKCGPVKKSELN